MALTNLLKSQDDVGRLMREKADALVDFLKPKRWLSTDTSLLPNLQQQVSNVMPSWGKTVTFKLQQEDILNNSYIVWDLPILTSPDSGLILRYMENVGLHMIKSYKVLYGNVQVHNVTNYEALLIALAANGDQDMMDSLRLASTVKRNIGQEVAGSFPTKVVSPIPIFMDRFLKKNKHGEVLDMRGVSGQITIEVELRKISEILVEGTRPAVLPNPNAGVLYYNTYIVGTKNERVDPGIVTNINTLPRGTDYKSIDVETTKYKEIAGNSSERIEIRTIPGSKRLMGVVCHKSNLADWESGNFREEFLLEKDPYPYQALVTKQTNLSDVNLNEYANWQTLVVASPIPAWADTTVYAIGDHVSYLDGGDTKKYTAVVAHTGDAGVNDPINGGSAFWKLAYIAFPVASFPSLSQFEGYIITNPTTGGVKILHPGMYQLDAQFTIKSSLATGPSVNGRIGMVVLKADGTSTVRENHSAGFTALPLDVDLDNNVVIGGQMFLKRGDVVYPGIYNADATNDTSNFKLGPSKWSINRVHGLTSTVGAEVGNRIRSEYCPAMIQVNGQPFYNFIIDSSQNRISFNNFINGVENGNIITGPSQHDQAHVTFFPLSVDQDTRHFSGGIDLDSLDGVEVIVKNNSSNPIIVSMVMFSDVIYSVENRQLVRRTK